MGFEEKKKTLYNLELPGRERHNLKRTVATFGITPPHEVAAKHLEENREVIVTKLMEAKEEDTLPPSYWENPIVRNSPEPVAPFALYIDGVPYSHTDSVIGWWLICILTGKRWCLGALRKRFTCKCGCRGWCTYHCVFAFLHWSLLCLALGIMPGARDDGSDWNLPQDTARAVLAHAPMIMKGMLLWIKGDWSEYSCTFGFPNWNSLFRPCFLCSAYINDMFVLDSLDLNTLPWHLNQDDEYWAACARCEHWVILTSLEMVRAIVNILAYDKRQASKLGRALLRDYAPLNLRHGDHLETFHGLQNIFNFDTIATFPFQGSFLAT